jgi:pimeloyl-ACP methyl ester carboxylesterase
MERLKLEDSTILSYDRYGEGPPLVLAHSSMSDHQSNWEMVKRPLSQRFTVYAMARRGRGQTTATQERRLEDEFGDVTALIEAIGEPTFLMGHCYGAHCAMGGAAAQPSLVSKLVLYEPPRPDALPASVLAELEEAARQGEWDLLVRTFLIHGPKIPPHVVDAIRASPFWAPMIADAAASVSDCRVLSRYEFDPAGFAALAMPVLLLTGSESPRDNYVTDAIASVLPDHQIVELQGQGHIAMAMAPDLFVDTVSRFLLG